MLEREITVGIQALSGTGEAYEGDLDLDTTTREGSMDDTLIVCQTYSYHFIPAHIHGGTHGQRVRLALMMPDVHR